MEKFKIKKGDKVVVISGKEKGKTGEILRILRDDHRVVVQGVNTVKRHQRATMTTAGGITTFEAPIHISNVAHLDPKDDKATRVGYKVVDGQKVRFAKRSGEIIDR